MGKHTRKEQTVTNQYRAKSDHSIVIEPVFHNSGSVKEFITWKSNDGGESSVSAKEFSQFFEPVPEEVKPYPVGTYITTDLDGLSWTKIGENGWLVVDKVWSTPVLTYTTRHDDTDFAAANYIITFPEGER